MSKKFSCILSNPPYQAPKNRKTDAKNGTCGSVLWKKFALKAFDMCENGGFVALIHPGQWRKPENDLFGEINKHNLKYLEMHNLDDGMKTFGVATGYDWYVSQKKPYNGETIIKDMDGCIIEKDLSKATFIPNSSFNLLDKIIAKDDEDRLDIIFSHSAYETRKVWMSKTQDDKFKYPCVYGLTKKDGLKLFYTNTKNNGHFGVPKVIIPISKYTDAHVDYNGDYGICQFAFGIKIDSKEDGENIKKAILSDKFNTVWKATEWIYNSKEWRIFKSFKKDFWKEFV